jgi:hypothetical protein
VPHIIGGWALAFARIRARFGRIGPSLFSTYGLVELLTIVLSRDSSNLEMTGPAWTPNNISLMRNYLSNIRMSTTVTDCQRNLASTIQRLIYPLYC